MMFVNEDSIAVADPDEEMTELGLLDLPNVLSQGSRFSEGIVAFTSWIGSDRSDHHMVE